MSNAVEQPEQPSAASAEDPQRAIKVLFVCTGNTCRSPMARAIAQDWLISHRPEGVRVEAVSAGVMAADGVPMTDHAHAALRSLGIDPGAHKSAALTPEMLQEADAVFCMTDGHRKGAALLVPGAAKKLTLLDPAGADVDDPYGGDAELYLNTAGRLRKLVAERLEQLAR